MKLKIPTPEQLAEIKPGGIPLHRLSLKAVRKAYNDKQSGLELAQYLIDHLPPHMRVPLSEWFLRCGINVEAIATATTIMYKVLNVIDYRKINEIEKYALCNFFYEEEDLRPPPAPKKSLWDCETLHEQAVLTLSTFKCDQKSGLQLIQTLLDAVKPRYRKPLADWYRRCGIKVELPPAGFSTCKVMGLTLKQPTINELKHAKINFFDDSNISSRDSRKYNNQPWFDDDELANKSTSVRAFQGGKASGR